LGAVSKTNTAAVEKPVQVLQFAIVYVKLAPKTLHNWQQQLDKKPLEWRPSNFPLLSLQI